MCGLYVIAMHHWKQLVGMTANLSIVLLRKVISLSCKYCYVMALRSTAWT